MSEQNQSVKPPAAAGTVALVATLVSAYMVSQFLRNSVAVIAPDLASELDLNAAELGLLASIFFFTFAAVQLPLGIALDRFGPRWSLLVGAGITVIGALMFAAATSPVGLIAARACLGLGCASSFMAPLALYAHRYPPERFATLTGLQYGLGSIGTLLATAPLALAVAAIGWRGSFVGVAAVTFVTGILVAVVIKSDGPGRSSAAHHESVTESLIGVWQAMRVPAVGRLFLMHFTGYSSFALIVGLWGGPYLTHVYGYGLQERGDLLLIPAVVQMLSAMAWGPLDRLMASYKWPVMLGALCTAAALIFLAIVGTLPALQLYVWFIVLGVSCAYMPVLIAHGRSLFPPHLVGRGITLLNMGTMGGVFVTQMVTGAVINLFPSAGGAYPLDAYRVVFALQGVFIVLSCLGYLTVRDTYRH